jgi:hypothetical protein
MFHTEVLQSNIHKYQVPNSQRQDFGHTFKHSRSVFTQSCNQVFIYTESLAIYCSWVANARSHRDALNHASVSSLPEYSRVADAHLHRPTNIDDLLLPVC